RVKASLAGLGGCAGRDAPLVRRGKAAANPDGDDLTEAGSRGERPMTHDKIQDRRTPRAPSLPDGGVLRIREVVVKYRARRYPVSGSIRTPTHAVEFAGRVVEDDAREHFLAIYLDSRHVPIGFQVVHIGS